MSNHPATPPTLAVAQPTPLQVGAYQDGRAAFFDGIDSTACPHRGPDSSAELRLLWVRGWVAAKFDAARAAYDELPDRHPSIAALVGRREPRR